MRLARILCQAALFAERTGEFAKLARADGAVRAQGKCSVTVTGLRDIGPGCAYPLASMRL